MTTKRIIPLMLFTTVVLLIIMVACSPVDSISGSEVTNENVIVLTGKVLDYNNTGVPNIEAKLSGLGFADTTDDNGNYTITVSKDSIDSLGIILNGLVDTLLINSNDEEITSYTISEFIDTLPNTYLVQRNVWGKLLTAVPVGSSVEAVIITEGEWIKRELWVNNATSSFSGFVYMRSINSGAAYSVYVNVYNSEGQLTGRSEVVTFPDQAGDIHIPDFHPTAGVPIVSFDTVYVKTDVWFNARDSHVVFTKEWSFSYNDSVVGTASGGSVPFQFLNKGIHSVTLTVSDGVDDPQVYSKEVFAINRPSSIVALQYGSDTVTINDTTHFSLTVSDPEGVKQILWDFGEGDSSRPQFDATLGGVSQVSHIWPSSSVVPLGEQVDFDITVFIIDSLNDTTVHTFPITVSNKAPVILSQSEPVFGVAGDTIRFEIEAEDDNRIVSYTYSHGGETFLSETGVLELIAPDTTEADYKVIMTAIDDDGNRSNTVSASVGINTWTKLLDRGEVTDLVTFQDCTIVTSFTKKVWNSWDLLEPNYDYSLVGFNLEGRNNWEHEVVSDDGSGYEYDVSGIIAIKENAVAISYGRWPSYNLLLCQNDGNEMIRGMKHPQSGGGTQVVIDGVRGIFSSHHGNIIVRIEGEQSTKVGESTWDTMHFMHLRNYNPEGEINWWIEDTIGVQYCYEMEDGTTIVFCKDGSMTSIDNNGYQSDLIDIGVSKIITAQKLHNGDFIVVHKLNDELFIRRINISGTMLWEISVEGFTDLSESLKGDITYLQNTNGIINLTILDRNGNLKTTQQLSREGDGYATAIESTIDSCYVVSGSLGGKGAIIKTDKTGNALLVY